MAQPLMPMTPQGAKALQEELQRLKNEVRIAISRDIAAAREHGDLKENAEYHAAKEQQGLVEARIRDLENKLSRLQVIDIAKIPNEGKVVFGVTVTLYHINKEEEVVYQIVGEEEASI